MFVLKSRSMREDSNGVSILLYADDHELHKFDAQLCRCKEHDKGEENNPDPNWHTVSSCFCKKKEITLCDPHLPIIFTCKDDGSLLHSCCKHFTMPSEQMSQVMSGMC